MSTFVEDVKFRHNLKTQVVNNSVKLIRALRHRQTAVQLSANANTSPISSLWIQKSM